MGTRALICVKVDTDWFICHQAFDGDKVPTVPGPELIASVHVRRVYRSLNTTLKTELPIYRYKYLHIWQIGRWVTVPLDADEDEYEEQKPHIVVDKNGGLHMLRKGSGKAAPYDACERCSLADKRCHLLKAECRSSEYYVSVPTV